jgi:predicted PurR-regulated permease PerM
MSGGAPRDLARTTFGVLGLAALVGVALWILQPFLGPTVWATMIVVATWPLLLRLQARMGGRRWAAVLAMTLALLLLFVVPLSAAVATIVDNADQLGQWARWLAAWRPPEQPPQALAELPVVGELLARAWEQATAMGLRDLVARLTPYAGDLTRWFIGEIGAVGVLAVQFLLTVLIAALLYAGGEDAADLVRRIASRLAGPRGVDAVTLAGGAIRGVALGVGVTALVQSLLGGIGLAVAGVPFAGLLTAVMFMLCIAQIGPLPVLLPAALWLLLGTDALGWGIFLLVWSGFAGTVDNVIRPLLIRLGADLPLLLIFAGVLGGLLAFGLVGIFVGPVVLAVAWTLLLAWVGDGDRDASGPRPMPPPDWRD